MSNPKISPSVVYQAAFQLFLARNPRQELEGLPPTHRVYGTEGTTYRQLELRECAAFAWEMAQAVVAAQPEHHNI